MHDTVRERVEDLLGLLDGESNRRELEAPAEWASYVLAFVPEAAEGVRSRLEKALTPLPAQSGAGAPRAEIDSAELFALGMLAPADDPSVTVTLTHAMSSGHLYNSFAAAVAMATVHGEKTPAEALSRIDEGGRTRMGYHGLFGDSWPHCGRTEPEVLGFLALGRGGARTATARLEMLPDVLAHSEGDSRAAVIGASLEMVFGPRVRQADAETAHDDTADLSEDQLKVLWAIAELPAAAWEGGELVDTLDAWGLPTERADFLAFAGVEDDTEGEAEETAAEAEEPRPGPSGPSASPEGGLFRRLFGGGSDR